MVGWMGRVQQQLDSWTEQQKQRQRELWPPWRWNWKWPWQGEDKRQKHRMQEEYRRRQQQIHGLCKAVKVDNVPDLQDLLGAMILSECVYKKPESELLRAVNNFKADFGGRLIPMERIQPSLEHVPHRYLLAESGDTLFASFVGTKHYKDIIADANVWQGAIFDEDLDVNIRGEVDDMKDNAEHKMIRDHAKVSKSNKEESRTANVKAQNYGQKPAAHRGFLTRANAIPAVEIYELAKKKDCKLVLCGHSLGGAVAALATLAILRVFSSSSSKDGNNLNIKCITFSQPPVGNAALKDYVHRKGWQRHFHTYCIPEDVIPRLLSPAYFQHYQKGFSQSNSKQPDVASAAELKPEKSSLSTKKSSRNERMVLGVGPIQTSYWRLSRLVPLASVQSSFAWLKGKRTDAIKFDPLATPSLEVGENGAIVQPLEIQEGTEGVSLVPFPSNLEQTSSSPEERKSEVVEAKTGNVPDWRKRVPSFPSYVPFGQLFLLERSSVEPLSALEYTRLTSTVQSVLLELKERFQSHTMRIYDLCTCEEVPSPVFMTEHLPHISHLQQWLGLTGTGSAELAKIAEPLTIRAATSLVPIGWPGVEDDKKIKKPLRVDVQGYGLHLCTLVQAQLNGQWCSTTAELSPYQPQQDKWQRMRIIIGAPLKQNVPLQANSGPVAPDAAMSIFQADVIAEEAKLEGDGEHSCSPIVEGLTEVIIHCSTDFMKSSKKVSITLRRVRLLGLEGAGKTSLFHALLGKGGSTANGGGIFPDMEWNEGVVSGVGYIDAAGVNLQDLTSEAHLLRQELHVKAGKLCKKLDLVVFVHNLAHKVPRLRQSTGASHTRPALAVLLDEVVAAGVPLILAITNKFSVSADRRQTAATAVMETYRIPPDLAVIVNSCPYSVHGYGAIDTSQRSIGARNRPGSSNFTLQGTAQKIMSGPVNLVQMPFRKRDVVLPVEGVTELHNLIHKVLLSHEEAAFEELARESLAMEVEEKSAHPLVKGTRYFPGKPGTGAAAAVGASFGIFAAIILGATSLRKS
ncbi:hypothetical protein O6H91_11G091900 [Diphasiastrum complanatum]|uniref:Uncharacterized protein n=1 Tax=Diphasiastrum complanatum TaxID=34168 RepID=A0ACC2CBS2_DIPCM|nr:hypothetical protein O6H91_11G091900 [Diphasiastrum complanatum]